MTERIKKQLEFFVKEKKHRDFRRDINIDISDIISDPSLTTGQKNARAHARILQNEIILVFPDERITGTRVIKKLPKWEHSPVNTDKFISHMLNLPSIGGISNNVADYEHTIQVGFEKRREEILVVLEKCKENNDNIGITFLENTLFLIDEIESYAGRIAAEAKKVKNDYIYKIFSNIPEKGAKSFAEALQFLKFLNHVIRYENDTHSPLGRFDQYLFPYLKADLEAGKLTYDEAFELVCEFFISMNRDVDIFFGIQQGDNGQSLILGGLDKNGNDAYNLLSEISIKASLDLGIIDPKINLRVNKKTPLKIFQLGSELTKKGLGFPQYANDDVVIPALVEWGYDLEDARDYAVAGCWEFIIPGYGAELVNIEAIPFVKIVNTCVYKDLPNCKTFKEFMQSIREAIFEEAKQIAERFSKFSLRPSTIHSILSKQAIQNARDISECGKYNNFGIHGPGIAASVDSLAAIKKFVFDEKLVSPGELINALDNNFEGYETIWSKLRNEAPKMGNDDDIADDIAIEFINIYADAFESRKNCFGGRFRPGTGSAMYYMWHAGEIGASANGLKKGEPLPANYSPSLNVKVKGPVSMFKSFSKPDLKRVCNGGPVTLELHDSVFRNTEAIDKVATLVKSFILMGGHQLQLNSINNEILVKAQKNPQSCRNLVVRVWGWSGYFVELSKEYQDHIIARTKMVV
jgi:pyruvate-formate lyase